MALGLVEVKHGSGVYVTESQSAAFGEALLIALRRSGASAWDVEHFQQIMIPELIALASTTATDEEIAEIREHIQAYRQILIEYHTRRFEGIPALPAETQTFREGSQNIMRAIFKASHNHVFQQLAQPLLNLRNLRTWQDDGNDTPESLTELEMIHINGLVDAIATQDPDTAREQARQLMDLPPVAIEAMKQTPIGEQPQIPFTLSKLKDFLTGNR
jgi:DNA-binding FadR family transcriptional regulator